MIGDGLAIRYPAVLLSTWFGLGYLPRVGGAVAALTGVPLAWALLVVGGSYGGGLVFVAATLLFWLSLWAVALYCRATGRDRPREIVVDRIVGLWLPLMFVRPDQPWQAALAVALFVAVLLLRPWPASWVGAHVPGALGIMLGGFVAGVYAALGVYVTVHTAEHPYVARLVERAL